mgnify:CR=1 FL=1
MTRIKYKIIKFFRYIIFSFSVYYDSPPSHQACTTSDMPRQSNRFFFHFLIFVFYISNIYITEGFPGDYNNGYIPLQDGIVFYTSLSLNYSVQCSSEHDYHLLLPSQRKNIFSFFPLLFLIYCFQKFYKSFI